MATTLNDYSILEVLEALDENEVQIKADGTFVDKDGTSHSLTVFDNTYFKHNCLISFRSWNVTLWDEPETAFPALFTSWWNSRKDLYLKQAYAYTLRYNPIENYASHEVMTDDTTEHEYDSSIEHEYDSSTDLTHGLETETTLADVDVTTTHPKVTTETTYPVKDTETTYPQKTTETTPYDTTETTTPNNATTTHSTKGFNSNAFVEVDKDVQSGSTTKTTTHPNSSEVVDETYTGTQNVNETYTGKETVEETYTGTDKVATEYKNHQVVENSGKDTTARSGKDTDTHSGTDTTTRNYTLDRTGNIGVQTASQMLDMEFAGLKQDLARRALTEFITRYCFQASALDV